MRSYDKMRTLKCYDEAYIQYQCVPGPPGHAVLGAAQMMAEDGTNDRLQIFS